jgi:hypothetical protein
MSASDPAHSPAHHTVVGLFDRPSAAREAMVALERKGIDALDIRLVDSPSLSTPQGARRTDLAVTGDTGRRYLTGGLAGAAGGAVVVGLVVGLVTTDGGEALLGAFIAAIPGFFVGGFFGGALRLPVDEAALSTYAADPTDSAPVGVEVDLRDEGTVQTAVTTLQAMHARSIEHRSR